MMDLNAKFKEVVEKLEKMDSNEFNEMLVRCGMDRIKPSIESDYVRCLRKNFSKKSEEYAVHSFFKINMDDLHNDFDLDNIGGAA